MSKAFLRLEITDEIDFGVDFPPIEVDPQKYIADATYATGIDATSTAHLRKLITDFARGMEDTDGGQS